jgi:hypothetical protein
MGSPFSGQDKPLESLREPNAGRINSVPAALAGSVNFFGFRGRSAR